MSAVPSAPSPAGTRPAPAALLLVVAGLLSLLGYTLLWIPVYRLNERFEYADLLLGAYPAVAHVLGAQVQLLQAIVPATVVSYRGTAALFSGLLVGLFVLYLGVLWLVRRVSRAVALAVLLGGTLAFQLVLFPTPGVLTTDVFSYALYGEIAGRLGGSPYVQAPDDYPTHPLYLLINPLWRDAPAVYGPVWISLSSLVGAALGGHVLAEALAYRLIVDLCHWLTLGLLWWALRRLRPEDETFGLALYAWNPLVVFEFAGSGHNDTAMLLFLPLCLGLFAGGHRWPALGALALSIATKYTTVLLLPLLAWWAVRDQVGWRRPALAAAAALAVLALVAGLYLPWWQGPATLGPIRYWLSTPLYANYAPIGIAVWVRDQISAAGWMGLDEAEQLVFGLQRQIVRLAYLLYLAVETLRLRRLQDLPPAAARVLLVFLLAVNTWVLPWYFTWVVALAALGQPTSRTTWVAVGFSVSAPLGMYWAQMNLESMELGAFVVYLAPLAALGLWHARRWIRSRHLHPRALAERGSAPSPSGTGLR